MWLALYFLVAFVQAIIVSRFILQIKADDSPVAAVFIFTLLAPLVTLSLIFAFTYTLIHFLVTGESPNI